MKTLDKLKWKEQGRKEREDEIIEILKKNGLNGLIQQIKESNTN